MPRIMNREMNSGAHNNPILFSVKLKGFSTFSSTNSIGLKLGMLPLVQSSVGTSVFKIFRHFLHLAMI